MSGDRLSSAREYGGDAEQTVPPEPSPISCCHGRLTMTTRTVSLEIQYEQIQSRCGGSAMHEFARQLVEEFEPVQLVNLRTVVEKDHPLWVLDAVGRFPEQSPSTFAQHFIEEALWVGRRWDTRRKTKLQYRS
jgi:hypothetical protein